MARPIEEGLPYFPLDCDFYDDPKILMVEEQYGHKGGYIANRLLCWIYRNGYYLNWNSDMALIFAKRLGNNITSTLVNDVVNALIEREFFDKSIFSKSSILTSYKIQSTWLGIIHLAKRKASIKPEYNLIINSVSGPVNSEETTGDKEETTVDVELSTQSKVKQSIVKERKENFINIQGEQIFEIQNWFDQNFKLQKPHWQKHFPLSNIDNCLISFFTKKAFETFNDKNHFKNAFVRELQFVHDKNLKEKEKISSKNQTNAAKANKTSTTSTPSGPGKSGF